jgi:alpha-1,2-mannosyltransferase
LPPSEGNLDFFNGRADFFQEWASATNFWSGLPIYTSHRITIERYMGYSVNPRADLLVEWNAHPPTSVLLGLPLAWLDYPDAVLVWNLVSLAALLASVCLIVQALKVPFSIWSIVPIVTLLFLCYPLREHLIEGQINLVLLLLLTGTWVAERSGRDVWAGILLGTATAIKLFPALLLLYFVLRRQWRTVASTLVSLAAITALTALVLGMETFQDYVREVLPRVAWFRVGWSNASLPGFWSKLLDGEMEHLRPWWRVEPLWHSPTLARAGALLSCAALLVLLARAVRQARSRADLDQTFALAVTAMLLAAPVAWENYLVILLLPMVLVWAGLPPSGKMRLLLLLIWVALWVLPPVAIFMLLIPGGHPWGVAGPVHTLTVLSFQCYALVGLFLLGFKVARSGASRAEEEGQAAGTLQLEKAREKQPCSGTL